MNIGEPMKTIIIMFSLSFFLISCDQESANKKDTDNKEPTYTITNNTEQSVAHITYQAITMNISSGDCIKVSESQFSELQIEVTGKGKISNVDNSEILCKSDKTDDCKPGNYSIENDRVLGGFFYDSYKLESSDKNTGDCIVLSVTE